jgi:hypothetical protein
VQLLAHQQQPLLERLAARQGEAFEELAAIQLSRPRQVGRLGAARQAREGRRVGGGALPLKILPGDAQ